MTGSQRDLTGRATPRSKSGSAGQRGRSAAGGSGGQLHSSKSVDYGGGGGGGGRGDHHGHGGGHAHRPGSRQAQVGLFVKLQCFC